MNNKYKIGDIVYNLIIMGYVIKVKGDSVTIKWINKAYPMPMISEYNFNTLKDLKYQSVIKI